jgi:hypothetical protein
VKPAPNWLALDANGRPAAASTATVRSQRADVSGRLAEAFEAQGIGVVTVSPDQRVFLSLLAAGSADPDVLEMRPDNAESMKTIIDRLSRTPSLFKPAIGLTVADIADVVGAVVIGADSAGAANVRIGDVITSADGKTVANAAALNAILADRSAGQTLALEMTGADGAPKRVEVAVSSTPRVISQFDPAVLGNRVLADLRARLAAARAPDEQSVLRLNLAVALARAGRWTEMQQELKQVQLPDGPGVGDGTVQYLTGVAALNLGDRASAEAAFKRAQASPGLLTENGPSVKEAAETMLAELQPAVR